MAEAKIKTATTEGKTREYQLADTSRGDRKLVIGLVVSDKMEKTITVQVTRLEKHAKYKKYLRRHTKFYAHDEKRDAKIGDTVEIQETRPLSKLKRWRLIKILARAGETGGKTS
jgi:small subunit ribosomal protein S17